MHCAAVPPPLAALLPTPTHHRRYHPTPAPHHPTFAAHHHHNRQYITTLNAPQHQRPAATSSAEIHRGTSLHRRPPNRPSFATGSHRRSVRHQSPIADNLIVIGIARSSSSSSSSYRYRSSHRTNHHRPYSFTNRASIVTRRHPSFTPIASSSFIVHYHLIVHRHLPAPWIITHHRPAIAIGNNRHQIALISPFAHSSSPSSSPAALMPSSSSSPDARRRTSFAHNHHRDHHPSPTTTWTRIVHRLIIHRPSSP